MRIVVLEPGGLIPHYAGNLCHELARRGHEVRLDTSRFLYENVEPLGGYAVEHAFFNWVFEHRGIARWRPSLRSLKAATYPLDLRRWASVVSAAPPDVLHVQWSLVPPLDLRVFRPLHRRGVRLVLTAHEIPAARRGPWVGAFSELCRTADAVVAHAAAPVRRLVEEFGVEEARVSLVPMGGPGKYVAQSLPRAEARALLGLRDDVPLALFFGFIRPQKGLDTLLEALSLARNRVPALELLVAGRPMQGWGRYRAQIERLRLDQAVHARLSFIPSDEVAAIFSAADVVVAPYRRATQSMAVLTAMHFGRPVVGTRVGGLPELIVEGGTGLLAEPDDPTDLARALVDALSDAERLRRMGVNALELASGRHAWETIGAIHEEIYVADR